MTFLGKNAFGGVVFIDTPGFEAEGLSDSDILVMIAQWLKRRSVTWCRHVHTRLTSSYCSGHRNVRLSGILYLHRISDNRMTRTPLKNHRIFRELCGTDALQHIVLTTTMWDEVPEGEGDRREHELCTSYWKAMSQQGSTVARFSGTMKSAWSVVEPFLLEANDRVTAQKSVRALWKSERRVQSIPPESLSTDDVIIA